MPVYRGIQPDLEKYVEYLHETVGNEPFRIRKDDEINGYLDEFVRQGILSRTPSEEYAVYQFVPEAIRDIEKIRRESKFSVVENKPDGQVGLFWPYLRDFADSHKRFTTRDISDFAREMHIDYLHYPPAVVTFLLMHGYITNVGKCGRINEYEFKEEALKSLDSGV